MWWALGTYSREQARAVREAASKLGLEAIISDDYIDVEAKVAELHPDLVLGTQMERHIAKRLGVPCAVISSPVHVQDFPARYSPQMGFRGCQRHFRYLGAPLDDGPRRTSDPHVPRRFRNFNDSAAASHLGHTNKVEPQPEIIAAGAPTWLADAELELKKIPFFVRKKARRNTETYAAAKGVAHISIETLYDAKAHFSK